MSVVKNKFCIFHLKSEKQLKYTYLKNLFFIFLFSEMIFLINSPIY